MSQAVQAGWLDCSQVPFAIGPGPGEEKNEKSRQVQLPRGHIYILVSFSCVGLREPVLIKPSKVHRSHVHLGSKRTIATRQAKLDLAWQVRDCLKASCGSWGSYEHASPSIFGWFMVPLYLPHPR